jgi:hypothetical protein
MRTPSVCLILVLAVASLSAQWANYPTPGLPRTKDGKPDLFAKAPRSRDGKPDLSGVWHPETSNAEEFRRIFGRENDRATEVPGMELTTISKYGITLFLDDPPGMNMLTPKGKEVFARRGPAPGGKPAEQLPTTYCLPLSIPLVTNLSEVHKIAQMPGLVIVLHELNNGYRQIYTDGRKLPVDPTPSWMGYSVGHWEGDALVVQTNGFNDRGWLDLMGHPQSEQMQITERYRRRDVGHMDVEMTFNDPVMYVRPFTITIAELLQPDTDILEYVCGENEKDRAHIGLR